MSRLRLLQIFGAALLVVLVTLAPLRLALDIMGAERRGLAARAATGTIWRGQLGDARFGAVDLGDVRLGLDIPGLFLGGGRLWFVAKGPAEGRGVLLMTGSRFGAAGLDARLPLQTLMPAAPFSGRLRLEDAHVEFRHGGCRSAKGRVRLEGLSLPGAAHGPDLVLSGGLSCRGRTLVAPLGGQAEGQRIDMLLTLEGSGAYRAETWLRGTSADFESIAVLAGFERTMEGFRRVDQGRLGGGGPT